MVFSERSQSRFQLQLKQEILRSVVRQDMQYFDKYPASRLQGKIAYRGWARGEPGLQVGEVKSQLM